MEVCKDLICLQEDKQAIINEYDHHAALVSNLLVRGVLKYIISPYLVGRNVFEGGKYIFKEDFAGGLINILCSSATIYIFVEENILIRINDYLYEVGGNDLIGAFVEDINNVYSYFILGGNNERETDL